MMGTALRWRRVRLLVAATVVAATPGVVGAAAAANPEHSYLVRVQGAPLGVVAARVRTMGGSVTEQLAGVGMLVADLRPSAAAGLAGTSGVASITPDQAVRLESTSYNPATDPYSVYNDADAIGARFAWGKGITGQGVDVALIDSGVSPVQGLDAPGKVVNGPDLSFDSQNPNLVHQDAFGHGTHLAGIIAGHDAGMIPASNASNSSGFLGIAPDARIINVRVADAYGASDVSQVIAGIDWVVQHAHDPGINIRVLNLSFGTNSTQSYQLDPLAFAAETAWKQGIVVVVSAGNNGTTLGHLTDPAVDPSLLAVGAADTNGTKTTSDDTVTSYSSRGDGTRNPSVVAPGQHVASLKVPGSFIDQQYGSGPGSVDSRFLRGSGTSQAAAMVSGATALVLQARPGLTPDQVKSVLNTSATPLAGAGATAQGYGEVNIAKAINTAPGTSGQSAQPSTGTGTLEGARGGADLVLNGTPLTGEQDIFGTAVNTAQLAAQETGATAWNGGTWNTNTWTGPGWQNGTWTATTWTAPSWAGGGWTGLSWDNATWTGLSWDNTSWAGTSWNSSHWAGTSWDGTSWDVHNWS